MFLPFIYGISIYQVKSKTSSISNNYCVVFNKRAAVTGKKVLVCRHTDTNKHAQRVTVN